MGTVCAAPRKTKTDSINFQNISKQQNHLLQSLTDMDMKPESGSQLCKGSAFEEDDSDCVEEEEPEMFHYKANLPEGWDSPGYQIAGAWWFSTEDWPPQNHDYDSDLQKLSFRKVELEDWYDEPDIDSKGRGKVFEIPLHRGLFQSYKGAFYDVKPREGCDIYQALLKKDLPELIRLYIEAMQKEIKDLQANLKRIREVQFDTNKSPAPPLSKWWYCCTDWPPEDYNPDPKLKFDKLKIISLNNWETEPLKTEDNYVKAFEVPLHPFFYQNGYASEFNLRPIEDQGDLYYSDPNSKNLYELLDSYATAMQKHLEKFSASHSQLLSGEFRTVHCTYRIVD